VWGDALILLTKNKITSSIGKVTIRLCHFSKLLIFPTTPGRDPSDVSIVINVQIMPSKQNLSLPK
jgi:hypothetical protein